MTYVVAATWTAVAGKEDVVAEALRNRAAAIRREEGCLMYIDQRTSERPREFFNVEQYTSQDAFDAHMNSAHFQKCGLETAVSHLESRRRSLYELLD